MQPKKPAWNAHLGLTDAAWKERWNRVNGIASNKGYDPVELMLAAETDRKKFDTASALHESHAELLAAVYAEDRFALASAALAEIGKEERRVGLMAGALRLVLEHDPAQGWRLLRSVACTDAAGNVGLKAISFTLPCIIPSRIPEPDPNVAKEIRDWLATRAHGRELMEARISFFVHSGTKEDFDACILAISNANLPLEQTIGALLRMAMGSGRDGAYLFVTKRLMSLHEKHPTEAVEALRKLWESALHATLNPGMVATLQRMAEAVSLPKIRADMLRDVDGLRKKLPS